MRIQLLFPPVKYSAAPATSKGKNLTLRELCNRCGVRCRASGAWVERKISIGYGRTLDITAQPGSWGDVAIIVPARFQREREFVALGAMAYALFDPVARESIKGLSSIPPPRGRPKGASRPLSTKERQRRFRRNSMR